MKIDISATAPAINGAHSPSSATKGISCYTQLTHNQSVVSNQPSLQANRYSAAGTPSRHTLPIRQIVDGGPTSGGLRGGAPQSLHAWASDPAALARGENRIVARERLDAALAQERNSQCHEYDVDLSGLQLTGLHGPTLKKLTKLRTLDVSGNQLQQLTLGNTRLEKVNASGNPLREVTLGSRRLTSVNLMQHKMTEGTLHNFVLSLPQGCRVESHIVLPETMLGDRPANWHDVDQQVTEFKEEIQSRLEQTGIFLDQAVAASEQLNRSLNQAVQNSEKILQGGQKLLDTLDEGTARINNAVERIRKQRLEREKRLLDLNTSSSSSSSAPKNDSEPENQTDKEV